jgi:acetyl-CoA acyltransferase
MRRAVVIDAVRTPVGRAHPEKGIYRDVRADDLSADLLNALIKRVNIPASEVEDIHWGCVKQQGEMGYDVARMAVIIAGLPIEVCGVTVNRNCGSSLQAINGAAQSIAADCEDVLIAGGVEHMHHVPLEKDFTASPRFFYRNSQAVIHMGLTAENLAARYKISRREQDEFSLRSHRRAAEATDSGWMAAEIEPTWGRDEEGHKPVFMPEGGTVTAGNSSPTNAGAAALMMMSEERAKELGLKPKVRIRAMAVAGVDPSVMGIGPVPATLKALERAKLKLEDIDLIEINEAFAAQALACIKLLMADPEKVNVHGGAVAIGHPLGASGARVATTLIHTMQERKAQFGLATMCIGAGQGITTIFESVA